MDTLFLSYPAYCAKETAGKRLYNGNPLEFEELVREGRPDVRDGEAESGKGGDFPEKIRIYDWNRNFIGIYSYEGTGSFYRPETLFFVV